jgi:acyl carrier protein
MDIDAKNKTRAFLASRLEEHHDRAPFRDDESLFVSGRLDSLAMTKVIAFLEESFGVDFADVSFDVELVDSVDAIETFLASVEPR